MNKERLDQFIICPFTSKFSMQCKIRKKVKEIKEDIDHPTSKSQMPHYSLMALIQTKVEPLCQILWKNVGTK